MIDLRSDTVTKPTLAMREAIARAEVGDDSLGQDPTTARLESVIAELLGHEAAVFFPSGTMANEVALQLHSPPGTEAIVEAHSHLVDWELGAPAALSGVQLKQVATPDGLLTAELVEAAIRLPMRYQLQTSAIYIENTYGAAGGKILPLEQQQQILEVARRRTLPVHLDGARLWNAAVATGYSEAELAAGVDTVMVSLSKGLGCPVGSMLAGTRDLMEKARWVRRRLGGAMRQNGILAAAGLHAIEHHRARLAEDHERARELGRRASEIPGVSVIPPETNMVMIDLPAGKESFAVLGQLQERGVLLTPMTATRIRAVLHLDITDEDIAAAAEALAMVLA